MTDQSQYLAQALAAMQAQPQVSTGQPPNLVAMQHQAQQKQAWEAANPGQSYMGHNLSQMGQTAMGGPLGDLAKLLGYGQGQVTPPAPAAINPSDLIQPQMVPTPGQSGGGYGG